MLGDSNEKITMFKIFHFPCYHGNQSWWDSQVYKSLFFGILELLQLLSLI